MKRFWRILPGKNREEKSQRSLGKRKQKRRKIEPRTKLQVKAKQLGLMGIVSMKGRGSMDTGVTVPAP
jgi:hypothetical protein